MNKAQSYLTHYGDANQSDPKQAVKMGYTETTTWVLSADKVPVLNDGDSIYIYVQAYKELGIGSDEIEKARYLHDGDFLGSKWSEAIVLTKEKIDPVITHVDDYIVGKSTWVTGEHSGSNLIEKVGLIVNDVDLGTVPISQADPMHFKYYRLGLHETDVAQVYLAGADGKELVRADVPILLQEQNLTLFIDGKEQTGEFKVKQISQDEYVSLSEKVADIVYAVQPNDIESDLVYFLGDTPIDSLKNTEGLMYNRNLLVGATSEWKDFSISGWTAEPHRKEISELGLSIGDKVVQSVELDNNNLENQGGIRSFIAQYDESDTQINTVSGETIAVGETGTSTATLDVAGNAIEVAISIGHSINDHADNGRYRKRKIANGTNGEIGNFTIAPEDIINSEVL